LAITGGGISALNDFFGVSGSSRIILEATVPYHPESLKRYIGSEKEISCTSRTARAMAMVAFHRGMAISKKDNVIGLGCTAALTTTKKRRGKDRCHIAIQTSTATRTFDLVLDKSLSRELQESQCKTLVLHALARTLKIRQKRSDLDFIETVCDAPKKWIDLNRGLIKKTSSKKFKAVFPGSFDPLHQGHQRMIKIAEQRLDEKPILEISIRNVDKSPLDFISMKEREFEDNETVFTSAPTFEEKSDLFPGATFLVGLDTLRRIDQPRYYKNADRRDRIIEKFRVAGNRFLAFGRVIDNRFYTLSDISISKNLKNLCDEIPESEFREDISSTSIRQERTG